MSTPAQTLTSIPHDRNGYERTLAVYRRECRPRNAHEDFLIDLMVQARCRLARIRSMETALVSEMVKADPESRNSDQVIAFALLNNAAKPYLQLQRAAAAAERSYHQAKSALDKCRIADPPPAPPLQIKVVTKENNPARPVCSVPGEQPERDRQNRPDRETRHHGEVRNRPLAA